MFLLGLTRNPSSWEPSLVSQPRKSDPPIFQTTRFLARAAHGVAATLRKSSRKRPLGVHPSGFLLGKCCGCSASSIHKSLADRVVENCKSILYKEGTAGLAIFEPSPVDMPWLWSTAEVTAEAPAKP